MSLPDETTEAPLVLVPRTTGHLVRLALGLALPSFWLFGAVLFVFPHVSPVPLSQRDAARCWDTAFGCLLAGPLAVLPILLTTTRGRWRIDPEGIEQRSPRGVVKAIRWSDVESVRLGRWESFTVRGKGRTIRLPLHVFPEPERGKAVQLLRRYLHDFDLTIHSPAPVILKPHETTALLSPGTFTAVALAILFGATLFYLGTPIPWPFVLLIVGCWMVMLLGVIGGCGGAPRQKNAAWRGRSTMKEE